eukprot:TRINITY_DN4090_c0_g1_i1.p1 TRINITY_DN4090_c0_g1~~TRINITY_DN4090_c0_g1_i1.p1  ORF type:complete len:195 (-),score=35.64 TRINITY_DN4090_c0_g1_i1:109-618(-)
MGSAAATFKSKAQVSMDTSARYSEFDDVSDSPKANKEGKAVKGQQTVRTAKCKPEVPAAVVADLDGTKRKPSFKVTPNGAAKCQEAASEESDTQDAVEGMEEDESLDDMTPPRQLRREDFLTCEFSGSCYRLTRDPEHGGPGSWVAWRKDSSTDRSNNGFPGNSDDKCN